MDRKKFFGTACSAVAGSCIGLGLLSNNKSLAAINDDPTPVVNVDARQIQNMLSYVEASVDEPVKKCIFERLGYEHTTSAGFTKWIEGYKKDLQSFFDMVNSNKDKYWEKMEYLREDSSIRITGRPVDRCACPFAQAENPPKSLCHYCCSGFQKRMFEMLFEMPVKVRIDEAFLLGQKRCSTTIFVDGKLKLTKA